MAARLTENDQIEFLLSCIRHSNYGQVDFDHVVKECQIVSKGAAAKRLSRLFQRYPAVSKPASGGDGNTTTTTASNTPKPATDGDDALEDTTAGKKSGKGGSPAKKSSTTAGSGAGAVIPAGGVTKKSASPAKRRAKKGKTITTTAAATTPTAAPVSGEQDELLLHEMPNVEVNTEEPYESEIFGSGDMYNASIDPAGLFETDA
ncbi:hypothetical protein PISL3812_06819 [Talaromyces islandicus]|uniref:Myb-like DNA-binding domain-containing protein n=1 Tax=Talaromyces islandicus TaxID=28573 RepID=A0A0U1M411_TALIS|nr:hypothetical protein PISL3812_06819 [Talaromyces islandicus]